MHSSVITKLLLLSVVPLQLFAAESLSVQNHVPSKMKSLMPLSALQLADIAAKKQKQKAPIKTMGSNTSSLSEKNNFSLGGGYGGNEQTSILMYDGLPNHLAAFLVRRDATNQTCYMENQNASVYHYSFWGFLNLVSYSCASSNKYHNGVYWNESLDMRNGGYASDNDVLYATTIISKMFQEWFGIPVAQNSDGSPLAIKIVTHAFEQDNAYVYENNLVAIGDGNQDYYPFTSPDILSLLLSYVFTDQHSHLDIADPKAGAINVAFASMTAQALQFYIKGQSDWQIGAEVSKTGQPISYMDWPSKDCGSRAPGDNCSIDHASQYDDQMPVHYSSGIYRRAFYLLATTPGWDVKKAFSVMVQANRVYWTPKEDFSHALCGVIKAARDLQYDESAVVNAFAQVGVDSQSCHM
ncbi:MAG: Zinc metalloproteinase [Legionella sp.]|uniref:M4 family metallopeptidase n=1 Tax=Legionella sp. TaxID=459 RepID=UPI003D0E3A49